MIPSLSMCRYKSRGIVRFKPFKILLHHKSKSKDDDEEGGVADGG